MKKAALTLLASVVGAAAFAQLTKDDEKWLKISEEALAEAKTPYPPAQFNYAAVREVVSDEPATFENLVQRVEQVARQVAFENDAARELAVRKEIAGLALWRFGGKFKKEGYEYAKANGLETTYFAIHGQAVGMSEAEELAGLVEIFERANAGDLWIFRERSARFARLLNTLPDAEAVAILKRINRAFSVKCAADDAYRPATEQIRTLLETY